MVAFDRQDAGADVVRPLKRAEYDQLVASGAFEDEKVELIRGTILRMSPSGPPHAFAIRRLTRLLIERIGPRAEINPQLPFAATDDSEPEPDIAVVPPGAYLDDHPARAHLVVEVSDTSLRRDRGVKAGIYAAARVPDYWVVNLEDHQIEVHREPTPLGYRTVTTYRRGERVALLAFADVEIAVDDVLPPA